MRRNALPQCSRITMIIHFIISVKNGPQWNNQIIQYCGQNSVYNTAVYCRHIIQYCIQNIVYNTHIIQYCVKNIVYNTASFHYQIFVLPYWLLADIQYCVQNIVYNTNVYYKHIILTIQLFTVCLDFCITIYWLLADLLK
jgi:hypothetical protein